MKVFLLLLMFSNIFAQTEFSGDLQIENRYFLSPGQYQNEDQSHLAFGGNLSLNHEWDNSRQLISSSIFLRVSDPDDNRNHIDIRELSYTRAYDSFQFKIGISKEFWGVTESVHLVDIINQTDFLENIDGEEKLGQLMFAPSLNTSYGDISFFILPQFRTRQFVGHKGRIRPALTVDENNSIYDENHTDWAIRWSHYYEDIEWALSYFDGQFRRPLFVFQNNTITPTYFKTKQIGLEAQWTKDAWLWKFEGIFLDNQIEDYSSAVTGFEYTLSNIWGGKNIGFLSEYIYDQREIQSDIGFYNHLFSGIRIDFADVRGTELLAGFTYNLESGEVESIRIESARRINENWKWEFELQSFLESESPFFNQILKDDFIQVTLAYHF